VEQQIVVRFFKFFGWFLSRLVIFRVSSFLGFSGAGDCCVQFTVLGTVSCWGLVFLGFQAF